MVVFVFQDDLCSVIVCEFILAQRLKRQSSKIVSLPQSLTGTCLRWALLAFPVLYEIVYAWPGVRLVGLSEQSILEN